MTSKPPRPAQVASGAPRNASAARRAGRARRDAATPPTVAEACAVPSVAREVPPSRTCAQKRASLGRPPGDALDGLDRRRSRILYVRDAPILYAEGDDARALRLIEWLCARGNDVTLVHRGAARGRFDETS